MQLCQHPNIVSILSIDFDNFKYIILPYYKHTLKKYLSTHKKDPINVKTIMHQILKGIHHLHSNGIIHRDIKPANIMIRYNTFGQMQGKNLIIEKELEVVIIDLGLSKIMDMDNSDDTSHTGEVYTLWYRAPEILLGSDKYHFQTDMWSIGCILGEILTGEPLFKGSSIFDQLDVIFKLLGTPTEQTWKGVKSYPKYHKYENYPSTFYKTFKPKVNLINDTRYDHLIELLKFLLTINPAYRCLSHEALNHSYISQNRDNILHFKENYMNIMINKPVHLNLDIFNESNLIITDNIRRRLLLWLMEVKV